MAAADFTNKINEEAGKIASEYAIGYKLAKDLSSMMKETARLEEQLLKNKKKLLKSDQDWQVRMQQVQEKIKKTHEKHQKNIDNVMEKFVGDMKQNNVAIGKWGDVFERDILPKIQDMEKAHGKELEIYESRRKLEEKIFKSTQKSMFSFNSMIKVATTGFKAFGKGVKILSNAIGALTGLGTIEDLNDVFRFFVDNLLKSEQTMADLVHHTGFLRSQLAGVSKSSFTAYTNLAKFGIDIDKVNDFASSMVTEFGSLGDITTGLIENTVKWSTAFNVAEGDIVKFVDLLTRGLGKTNKETDEWVNTLVRKARGAGVSVNAVMQDVASHTNFIAMYTDRSGKNIAKAAVFAKRLGTNLSTVESISNKFLDLDSALSSTMEFNLVVGTKLDAMTLHRMAITGDIVELQETILKQLSQQGVWESKNVLQRRMISEQMGVSADEAAKMVYQYRKWGPLLKEDREENARIEEQMYDAMTWWDKIIVAIKSKFLPYLISFGKYLNDKINPIVTHVTKLFNDWAPSVKDVIDAFAKWDFSGLEKQMATLSDKMKDYLGFAKDKSWIDSIWDYLANSPVIQKIKTALVDVFKYAIDTALEYLAEQFPIMMGLMGYKGTPELQAAKSSMDKLQGSRGLSGLMSGVTNEQQDVMKSDVFTSIENLINKKYQQTGLTTNQAKELEKIINQGAAATPEQILNALTNANLLPQKAFAKGGIVTKPTHALIGEAGPEMVIPLGKNSGYSGGSYKFASGGIIAPISRGKQGMHIDPAIMSVLGAISGQRTGTLGAMQDYADPANQRQRERDYVQQQREYQKAIMRTMGGQGGGIFGRSVNSFSRGIKSFAKSIKEMTGVDLKAFGKEVAKSVIGPTVYGIIDRGMRAGGDIRNAIKHGGVANWVKAAGSTANVINPNATKEMARLLADQNVGIGGLLKGSAGAIFNSGNKGPGKGGYYYGDLLQERHGKTRNLINQGLGTISEGITGYNKMVQTEKTINAISKGISLDKETIEALAGTESAQAKRDAIASLTIQQLRNGNLKAALGAQLQQGGKLGDAITKRFGAGAGRLAGSFGQGFADGGLKGGLKAGLSTGYDMAGEALGKLGPWGKAAQIGMQIFKKPLASIGKKLFGIGGPAKSTIKASWNSSLLSSLKSRGYNIGQKIKNSDLVDVANKIFPYQFSSMEDIAASGFLGSEDREGAVKKGGTDFSGNSRGFAGGGVVYSPSVVPVAENGPEVITPLKNIMNGLGFGGTRGKVTTTGTDPMLTELRGLRTDIQALKDAIINRPMKINMDGRKVADIISTKFEEIARN